MHVLLQYLGIIALGVTVLLGVNRLIKDVHDLVMWIYGTAHSLAGRYYDKRVFRFIRDTKTARSFYTVKEIATALNISPHRALDSLRRLEHKQKVQSASADEAAGGLWRLHDLGFPD